MNPHAVDIDLIDTLTALIPTDCWIAPDLATFGPHMPPGGSTDRGVSLRLRAILGLPAGPRRRHPEHLTIIGQPTGCDDIIARANCRMYDGDRYLWRRYAPGTDHAAIERDAEAVRQAVHLKPLLDGLRIEPPPTGPATPPAPPARPASTSIGRMPDPELLRLYADAGDELGRRGLLSPLPKPEAAPVSPMSAAAAWDIVREALADLPPELLRRMAADTSAERERRREALQALLAALG
jgi:hypothetical protein